MNNMVPFAPSRQSMEDINPELRWSIRSWMEPGTDGVWRRENLSPAGRALAVPLLEDWGQHVRPVTRDELKVWLLPLVAIANTPMAPSDFAAKLSLVGAAVDGYPAACFTAQTRAYGLRRWKWFPTPQEVCELLDPIKDSITGPYEALRQAMDAKPEREWQPVRGAREAADPDHEAKRAANAAFLKQFEADGPAPREPIKAKPLPLSDGQLLIEYERLAKQGNEAAAIRVRMLRNKLGQQS